MRQLPSAQDLKAFEQIVAPFPGTITARYIEVGSLVASGSAKTVRKLFDLGLYTTASGFYDRSGIPAVITLDEFPGRTFAVSVER
jgi:hypothetical protein